MNGRARNVVITVAMMAIGVMGSAAACADDGQVGDGQVGNGNTTQNGVKTTSASNGNNSVLVSIVNGQATVVVNGVQLFGEDAQPYIDAAQGKRRRP